MHEKHIAMFLIHNSMLFHAHLLISIGNAYALKQKDVNPAPVPKFLVACMLYNCATFW